MLGRRVTFGLRPYAPVLRTPGALMLLLGTLLGRASGFGGGLAVLLAVHDATGSFAVAGTAGGAFAVSVAVGRVVQGRLVDRVGVALVMAPASLLCIVASAALALACARRAPDAALLGLAAAAGASAPGVGALSRMLWAGLTPDPERRVRAFALDTLAAELASMLGPALAAVLVTSVAPAAGLMAMAALAAAGAALLVASPAARGHASARARAGGGRSRARGGLARPLLLPLAVLVGIGLMGGAIEVAVPAFALAQGRDVATGPLLVVWAGGSAVGGLWYGARSWRAPYETRLLGCLVCLGLACAALPLATSVLALGGLLVLAGMPVAPTITTLYLLLGERVAAGRLTEAFSWMSSAGPIGSSLGAPLGGWAVAAASPRAALAVGALLVIAPLAVTLVAARRAPAVVA